MISLNGTNLTDKITYSEMFNQNGFPTGAYSGLRGAPREIDLSVDYDF